MDLTAYTVLGVEQRQRVPTTGIVVGRFAVRMEELRGMSSRSDGGIIDVQGKTAIDHLPSGYIVAWLNDAPDALLVADDLSRFALEDVSGTTPDEVVRQLGPDIVDWLGAAMRAPRAFGFRVWWTRRGIDRPIEGRACNAVADLSPERLGNLGLAWSG